ncbi:serine O-acetyltransferase [Coprobacter sp.]
MINSKEDLKYYLEKDKYALGIKKKKPGSSDYIWKFQRALRYHEYYNNTYTPNLLYRVRLRYWSYKHRYYGMKLGFTIPINTFGAGLRINHFGLIVVSGNARIGEFCDIHQGVNIGQNKDDQDVPVLGNNVWIGPGVKIFGKISIADEIAIGANSVVTRSFEEKDITIAGIPAKKIKDTGNIYKRFM